MTRVFCTSKHFFVTFLLLVAYNAVSSQTAYNANNSAGSENKELTLSSAGLQKEAIVRKIFLGDFLNIPFGRDNMNFAILFNAYLTAYAKQCDGSLPSDKIELKRRECAKESVTTNARGVEISRTCIEWVMVSTGLYASPEMYNAKTTIERLHAGDALYNVSSLLFQGNPVGNATNLDREGKVARADMIALVDMNGCTSPGLMRFQENLRLFALNKTPVRATDQTAQTPKVSLSANQHFEKLAEDLIYEHSKKWLMNKYQRGSASNIVVTSKDTYGRPSEIKANYLYQGVSGKSTGSVRITFNEDGFPECLYFFDFPSTCRTADRNIVLAYANGAYQKQ